ncbi:MAG: hypothetical protein VKJ64_14785 [Leptolyngbyaceae bacterium]|nr:hypothetical protein [Leptolyngbyaceae bacterium]
MIKLTVDQILASIEALSAEEKQDLKARLDRVFATPAPEAEVVQAPSQSQAISIGRDFHLAGEGVTADFSQTLTTGTAGGSASERPPASQSQDLAALVGAIAHLKQAIESSPELNLIEKQTVAVPLNTLAEELKQPEPDKGLIDQTIVALKKGLNGVQTLAEPVMKVSSLVAKAWLVL